MGGYHDKCEDIMSTVGVFSTMGDYLEYRGGYLEYHGGCSVPWGNHDACGGYQEYHGDIIMYVGDIMSTMGVFSTVGIS